MPQVSTKLSSQRHLAKYRFYYSQLSSNFMLVSHLTAESVSQSSLGYDPSFCDGRTKVICLGAICSFDHACQLQPSELIH